MCEVKKTSPLISGTFVELALTGKQVEEAISAEERLDIAGDQCAFLVDPNKSAVANKNLNQN